MGDFDFSWQWKRQSEVIGDGCPRSDSKLSETLNRHDTPGDIAKAKGQGLYPMTEEEKANDETFQQPAGASVAEVLDAYNHNPKEEHPMYITTNNFFGKKRPTIATFTGERMARSQNFSNSFNRIKYRDQGLNTSITRSAVHKSLDL